MLAQTVLELAGNGKVVVENLALLLPFVWLDVDNSLHGISV